MKRRIEHPKVFISYAWGTEEHDEKVIALATSLKGDGVDVVFDKWQLKEGNDTFSFMEKSVLDDSITNVLILIDSTYAKKANEKTGGVGTETQIISPEVYSKVEQQKFIPVVFERDKNGNICKPQYLKTLLHFDLSMPDKFDIEYQRMVRSLYGIDTYKEPELGNPPAWLDETPKVSYKSMTTNDFFRGLETDSKKKNTFENNLEDIKKRILEYTYSKKEIVSCYLELKSFRDEFLLLVQNTEYVKEGYKQVATFLEELMKDIRSQQVNHYNLKTSFVHECFIYVVAYYFKRKAYEALRYILNKTYFAGTSNFCNEPDSYNCFYEYNEALDKAVCNRDGKKYCCGTAELWIENINIEICNKDEFVSGDLFCYNASLLISNYDRSWAWFPITYIYNGDEYRGSFATCSKKLISKEHLENIRYVLNYESVNAFKTRYQQVEEDFLKRRIEEYRYDSRLETAKTFWDYIKTEELGNRN